MFMKLCLWYWHLTFQSLDTLWRLQVRFQIPKRDMAPRNYILDDTFN